MEQQAKPNYTSFSLFKNISNVNTAYSNKIYLTTENNEKFMQVCAFYVKVRNNLHMLFKRLFKKNRNKNCSFNVELIRKISLSPYW